MTTPDPGAALRQRHSFRDGRLQDADTCPDENHAADLHALLAAPAPPPAPLRAALERRRTSRERVEALPCSKQGCGHEIWRHRRVGERSTCNRCSCRRTQWFLEKQARAALAAPVGVPAEGLRCVRRKGHEGAHTPFMAWKTDTFERCGAEVPITAEEIERRGFVAEDMGTAWSRGPNEPFAATPAATGLDVERLRRALRKERISLHEDVWYLSEHDLPEVAAAYAAEGEGT